MLGIYKYRNYHWLKELWALPSCILEVMSFGYLTIRNGKIRRDDFPWLVDLACLGNCLVILLSFGRLECDWIERSCALRRKC